MKITSLLSTVLLLSVTGLHAEDKPAGDPPKRPEGRPGGPGGPGGKMPSPEERVKMMTEKLGLTQEQQDKIKAIIVKNADALKAAMEKGRENLSEEDRNKVRELMKTQGEEIQAVLTEEQKAKFKEMRGGRGPGGPGGPPGEGKEGGRKRPGGPGGPPREGGPGGPPPGAPEKK